MSTSKTRHTPPLFPDTDREIIRDLHLSSVLEFLQLKTQGCSVEIRKAHCFKSFANMTITTNCAKSKTWCFFVPQCLSIAACVVVLYCPEFPFPHPSAPQLSSFPLPLAPQLSLSCPAIVPPIEIPPLFCLQQSVNIKLLYISQKGTLRN
jgi:hypothetical protein